MILDSLQNIDKYTTLHPLFKEAAEYLRSADLNAGGSDETRIELRGESLVVNISCTEPKNKEQARLETHTKYIDIQVPLSDVEIIGYTPLANLPAADYDPDKDITFYEGLAENYLVVAPGMFVVFFPEDGHAPAISEAGLRKIVIKVLV